MMAVAVVLLVSAIALFCYSGDDGSDADSILVPNVPHNTQGPEMREGGMPPMDRPLGNEVHPQGPPRYVIDAPDRPDGRPERIIDDYGRMYEEKRALEEEGAEVFVYDPELERDAGKELAEILNDVFDGAIVPERPEGAEEISSEQLPDGYDLSFLELLLEKAGKDTWLGQMISVMISQYISESGSEGIASYQGRDDYIPDYPDDVVKEDADDHPQEDFVDDIPGFTPSSVEFLVEHGFDGGTAF